MNLTDGPRSEVSYGEILDVLTDGVLVVGPGGIEYVNSAFTRMSGYRLDEVTGQDPLLLASDEHDRGFHEHAWGTAHRGCPWQGRMIHRWKDGTLCEQDVTIAPVSSAGGAPTHFVAVMRHRTKRRALELQLARIQKQGIVATLAGNLAHDFNNLLTIIGSNVEIVLESVSENDPRRGVLLDVQKASDQAAELTRDQLDFIRKAPPRWIDCSLSRVAAEAVRLMRHILPPEVELRTGFSSDPLPLRGDPTQLHHLIVNLCVNAREAMPEGGVLTLSTSDQSIDDTHASTIPNARAGRFVVLSVEGTGHGMKRRVLDDLSGSPLARTPHPGDTLGLAVVRDVVDTHQGWIAIESSSGQSARVDVYFPFRTTRGDKPGPTIDPALLCGTGTVLLVDDQSVIVALLRTALESRGYQTLTADTAAKAFSLFEQHRHVVAAVVLDWDSPGVDEFPLVQRLRKVAPALPMVLIGDSFPPAGAPNPADESTRFVAKPFTSTKVLEALKSVMGAANRSTVSET